MKGTDKQVAYAKAVLEGAKAWYAHDYERYKDLYYAGRNLAAIKVIELVEEGRIEEAQHIIDSENPADWLESVVIFEGEKPVISASKVIDALKMRYYLAKDKGLI